MFHKAASLHLFDAFRRRPTIIETVQRLSKHIKTLYCLYSIDQKEILSFTPRYTLDRQIDLKDSPRNVLADLTSTVDRASTADHLEGTPTYHTGDND